MHLVAFGIYSRMHASIHFAPSPAAVFMESRRFCVGSPKNPESASLPCPFQQPFPSMPMFTRLSYLFFMSGSRKSLAPDMRSITACQLHRNNFAVSEQFIFIAGYETVKSKFLVNPESPNAHGPIPLSVMNGAFDSVCRMMQFNYYSAAVQCSTAAFFFGFVAMFPFLPQIGQWHE